jgi:phosphopantothenoylcysteine decarboxylase/phosphopantothenate--cysteine ligase
VWQGRHVVLGVSGGIACYKSCTLARRLTEAGARVDVIMTSAATKFVTPLTFEALTRRPVLTSLWESGRALSHVRLGQVADLLIVAPATANLIARLAQGVADDALTACLLARRAPLLLAPAMNDEMYANTATEANLAELARPDVRIVGPVPGALAEGPSDRPGRMSEPEAILREAERWLAERSGAPLAGQRVLITAGPTREPLDPVRVVTNRSSGRMGYRLAEAAYARGALVTLISGPTSLPDPDGPVVVRVETTAEMLAAVSAVLPETDVLVMAAAPADFRPSHADGAKRPRGADALEVTLDPTPDILLETQRLRKSGATIVGFALETGDAVTKGAAKRERKHLDLIVVNDAQEPGAGFDVETNRVTLVTGDRRVELPLASKRHVAEAILDAVQDLRGR